MKSCRPSFLTLDMWFYVPTVTVLVGWSDTCPLPTYSAKPAISQSKFRYFQISQKRGKTLFASQAGAALIPSGKSWGHHLYNEWYPRAIQISLHIRSPPPQKKNEKLQILDDQSLLRNTPPNEKLQI